MPSGDGGGKSEAVSINGLRNGDTRCIKYTAQVIIIVGKTVINCILRFADYILECDRYRLAS